MYAYVDWEMLKVKFDPGSMGFSRFTSHVASEDAKCRVRAIGTIVEASRRVLGGMPTAARKPLRLIRRCHEGCLGMKARKCLNATFTK